MSFIKQENIGKRLEEKTLRKETMSSAMGMVKLVTLVVSLRLPARDAELTVY